MGMTQDSLSAGRKMTPGPMGGGMSDNDADDYKMPMKKTAPKKGAKGTNPNKVRRGVK